MGPRVPYHQILINPFPTKESFVFDVKKIAIKAAVTAVQAVLSVLIAAGFTNLSIDTLEAVLVAALGGVASVLYNTANQWLAAHQGD